MARAVRKRKARGRAKDTRTELPVVELVGMFAGYNPRKISDHDFSALQRSLREFGPVQPIVVNRTTSRVVGGHQRIRAAQELKIDALPVVWVELGEVRERQLNLALNRIVGDWDQARLATVLGELRTMTSDLELTGFTEGELDDLLDVAKPGLTDADAIPEKAPARTKRGDLWSLGGHRLLCGDAKDEKAVERVCDSAAPVALMVTDPPYCSGSFQEAGKACGTWGSIASDNLSTRGYIALQRAVLAAARPQALYCFTDWRMWISLFDTVESSGIAVRSMIVWDKGSPGLGSLWRTQHELILFGDRKGARREKGRAGHGNVIAAPRTGNVHHYTEKPVGLLVDLLGGDASSPRGPCDVYDPFLGSGTTLIAAEKLNRRCFALEIEPRYCDVAVKRWETFTGQKAKRSGRAT